MLNASLTVRKGEANSHANKGWELLTGKAIEVVARTRTQGVVFMAWGKFAQGRCAGLDVGLSISIYIGAITTYYWMLTHPKLFLI